MTEASASEPETDVAFGARLGRSHPRDRDGRLDTLDTEVKALKRELKSCQREDEINDRLREIGEQVFALYRDWDVMPLKRWFNRADAASEVIECMDANLDGFIGRTSKGGRAYEWMLPLRTSHSNRGKELCEWLFPHLSSTPSKGNKSLRERFDDDTQLRTAIRKAVDNGGVLPSRVRAELEKGPPFPRNFPPMVARAIFERFTEPGETIWDPCAGWGGRMLGALTSRKNNTYIATEVDERTIDCLRQLGELIEAVTGRCGSFDVIHRGSEDFADRDEDIDFVFTSPPYFDTENYGHGVTNPEEQSHVKFPTRQKWVAGYVKPTVANIAKALRPGGQAMINIDDSGSHEIDVVDAWAQASLEAGLILEDAPALMLTTRPGRKGSKGSKTASRASGVDYAVNKTLEPLLLFRKP